jgi:predicted 3-demethylubiquinone-9 3-methyltransferase (glyoxalase superfamily)
MVEMFTLAGQLFGAINGGPTNKFTPAISLSVACDRQEIDRLWETAAYDRSAVHK